MSDEERAIWCKYCWFEGGYSCCELCDVDENGRARMFKMKDKDYFDQFKK